MPTNAEANRAFQKCNLNGGKAEFELYFFTVIHCIHYTEAYLSQLCLMQYSALLNYHLTETITVYFWNGNPPFVCHFEWIISYVRKQWSYKVDHECIK